MPSVNNNKLTHPACVCCCCCCVSLTACSRFSGSLGEGTIKTQGDDTDPADATYTNRTIIDGTGVFNDASGYLTCGGNPATTNPGPWQFVLTAHKGY
jgi:hypothetical protein